MNSKRPVNLDITTIKLPLPAYTSILHRISGILLFVGVGFLLYALDLSLSSEQSFAELKALMSGGLVKFIVWVLLSGLIYHFVAGVKHLLMDVGIGEGKESGKAGAIITIVLSAVLIVLAGGVGMVTNITNLSRSGLYDWMLQRLSAIILAAYTLFIGGYVLINPGLDFQQWSGLFEQTWMKVFTLLAILSIAAHAWVGMWTIATDYLNARAFGNKSVLIRFPFQLICFVAVFSYIVWGIQILWGN